MKKYFFSLILIMLLPVIVLAQYNTGDSQFNLALTKIDDDARLNFASFKSDISINYSISERKIDSWSVQFGMKGGDIYLILEISRITKKPVEEVFQVYRANKTKGWGALSKELGIKPGSPEFHALKGGASDKAGKSTDKSKGKGKAKS